MAGQSEAADDLIAELAKLMAQDAQGDRKAQPSVPVATSVQTVPVRIPGGPAPTTAPEGLRPSPVVTASLGKPEPFGNYPVAQAQPASAAGSASASGPSSEPFQFDFGIRSTAQQTPIVDEATTVTATPVAPEPAFADDSATTLVPQEHDSIADLISAEMAAHPATSEERYPDARPTASTTPGLMSPVEATPRGSSATNLGGASADRDRFRVPPVFGLGSAPAAAPAPVTAAPTEPVPSFQPTVAPPVVAAAPTVDDSVAMDPIDEIENLIGRAMRVEFDLPEEKRASVEPVAPTPRPAPSPALRSLATPVLPTQKASDLSTADQTIFAAAQATGAKVGWVNEPVSSQAGPEVFQAAPRQRRALGISRALAGPLVAITLLLAAGFGLYWVLGFGSRDSGPAPLLTADASPTKEAAPVAAADTGTTTQSVVFNEMDGVAPGTDEQLVSRDQTDVNEVTQVAAAASDQSEEGLANRKVRTVKVRPDGTIVSGDDSVAGSAILPVDRPNVPAVPGAETASPELLANIEPAQPAEPIEATPTLAPIATVVPVEPGSTVPAVDLAGNPIADKSATIPRQRPSGLRLPSPDQAATETLAAPVVQAASSLTVPGATEVEALGNTAPAYVQLASQRSEADARQSAQNMVTRYGPLFAGANLEVQRVDLGAKGVYYRVRVPASSIEQANMICTNVKAAGGDCFTM